MTGQRQTLHKSLTISKPRSSSLSEIVPPRYNNIQLQYNLSKDQTSRNQEHTPKPGKRSGISPECPEGRKQIRIANVNYWLGTPIPLTNRYEGLQQEQQDGETDSKTAKEKTPKSPPIFVAGVSNIQPLT